MENGESGVYEPRVHETLSKASLRAFGFGGLICAGGLTFVALSQSAPVEVLGLLALVIVAAFVAILSASRGGHRVASVTFAVVFMVAALAGVYLFGGVQTSSSVSLVSGVALCGVLLGRRGLIASGVIASIGTMVAAWDSVDGWLPESAAPNTVAMATGTIVGNIVMIGLVFLLGHRALDVSEARRVTARQRLKESEALDPVSNSLSLSALHTAIAGVLSDPLRRSRSALLVIALDHGQLIRLGFGQATRGAVLKSIAERLRDVTRPLDRVARSGDEEFAVLAQGAASLDDALALAARIRDAIDAPVQVGDRPIGLRIRIGVVTVSPDHTSSDCVLRDGHAALSAAGGGRGSNIGVFEAGVVRRAQRALELDAELERAIAEEELVPWYQPIVSLVDGRLEGFEALVRWETMGRSCRPGSSCPGPKPRGPSSRSTDWS